MLRKRDIILSKVKVRIRKTSCKYGIEITTSVKHANNMNRINKNTFWRDAITKEMTEVGVGFEVLGDWKVVLISWKKVTGHLVWDAKMDFARNS